MFYRFQYRFISFLFLYLGMIPAVFGEIGTTNMLVSVDVVGDCTIATTPLVFGVYHPNMSRPTQATSRLRVLCTLNTPYHITLDQGAGPAATTRVRTMSAPQGTSIRYTLSQNLTHTINWGNTMGVDTRVGKGNGLTQFLTVYGAIPSRQNVDIGTYRDVVNVNIIF